MARLDTIPTITLKETDEVVLNTQQIPPERLSAIEADLGEAPYTIRAVMRNGKQLMGYVLQGKADPIIPDGVNLHDYFAMTREEAGVYYSSGKPMVEGLQLVPANFVLPVQPKKMESIQDAEHMIGREVVINPELMSNKTIPLSMLMKMHEKIGPGPTFRIVRMISVYKNKKDPAARAESAHIAVITDRDMKTNKTFNLPLGVFLPVH
ncbi:MAG: hypothetical protein RI911_689 [Candidatus Parcubacteria bacterium]|jgi:hypothetical protein